VQIYELDGGFFAATLSEAGDPEAPNLSGQVKTRHILAVDAASLEPQILACLVADFGMLQMDAALVPRVMLIEGEVITPEPGPQREGEQHHEPQREGEQHHEPQREA
jgi:hypothetical protein